MLNRVYYPYQVSYRCLVDRVYRPAQYLAMLASQPMYSITYHKPEKYACLTWHAGTEGMDDHDFQATLEVFAECALQHSLDRLVIDVRDFRHRPSAEVLAWRDEVTVEKYNRAGIARQAWVWPGEVSTMQPSSDARSHDERYFSSREAAVEWVCA